MTDTGHRLPYHSEFFDQDFRKNRPSRLGIPLTNEIILGKHQLLFPRNLISGKRILDIGCFIGQTVDWCLSNGAAHVTGVDASQEFCATAKGLLSKYYQNDQYSIINQSADDFFIEHDQKYDLVACLGVIFGHHDHVWFLNQLSKLGDHIIIESRHPKCMWKGQEQQMSNSFWHDLEYNIPYTEWQQGQQTMMVTRNASARLTAANSSIAAIATIMELAGFRAGLSAYEKLKQMFPDNFGMIRDPDKVGRFVIEFIKDHDVQKHLLIHDIFDPKTWPSNLVRWSDLK